MYKNSKFHINYDNSQIDKLEFKIPKAKLSEPDPSEKQEKP